MPELDLPDLEKEFEVGAPMLRVAQVDAKVKKKKEVATLLGHTRAQNICKLFRSFSFEGCDLLTSLEFRDSDHACSTTDASCCR